MSAPVRKATHIPRGLVQGLIIGIVLAVIGYFGGYVLYLLSSQQLVSLSVANITSSSAVYNIAKSNFAAATVYPYLFLVVGLVIGLAFGVLRELVNED